MIVYDLFQWLLYMVLNEGMECKRKDPMHAMKVYRGVEV
jgi:hypothetical protein